MTFRITLISCALTLVAAAAVAQDTPKITLKGFIDKTLPRMADGCAAAKAEESRLPANASSRERFKNQASQYLSCECMPKKLEVLASRADAQTPITPEQAMEQFTPLVNGCGAVAMKKFVKPMCEAEENLGPGIKDRQSYCGCLVSELDRFSDEQIANEAVAAYKDSVERAQAAKEGRTPPPRRVSSLESVEGICRDKQAATP